MRTLSGAFYTKILVPSQGFCHHALNCYHLPKALSPNIFGIADAASEVSGRQTFEIALHSKAEAADSYTGPGICLPSLCLLLKIGIQGGR